jgi:hypothetical protein
MKGKELAQRKFQADGKKQENHADPRQCLHLLRIPDQHPTVGAYDDPGQEKPYDGGELQLLEKKDDGNRGGENDDELL